MNKETLKKYKRLWVAKRRALFFSVKSCIWCGSKENLELHHVDPATKDTSSIWSWSEERRNKEIEKCIVLCKDCHYIYHTNKCKTWAHGIASTYKKGCRCLDCRYAQYRTMKTKKAWYEPINL